MKPTAKKKRPNSTKVRVPGDKKKKSSRWRSVEWVAIGGDVSMSTISLAGIARTKEGKVRHGAISIRWEKDHDYLDRLRQAAKAHDAVLELFKEMKIMPELNQVYFAIEEAVPLGAISNRKGKTSGQQSQYAKQQIQISGAFIGGLLRWGWPNIFEISANQWRKLVADDLAKLCQDFTIHHSKWKSQEFFPLPKEFHPGNDNVGKYRAHQWVMEFHPTWDGGWSDIINHSKRGHISRPDTSKAGGLQSDDRYESYAMAEWMRREIKRGGS